MIHTTNPFASLHCVTCERERRPNETANRERESESISQRVNLGAARISCRDLKVAKVSN